MSFRDAFRRRTPGYAGSTLEEQLLRDALLQSQNGQVLTPQNQQAITRPRTVTPVPEETIASAMSAPSFKSRFAQPQPQPEPTFDGKPIIAPQLNGSPFGTRDRRTQPRDLAADDAQALRDLQLQPRGTKDKIMDVIDAVNSGFGNKPRTTLTKRERGIKEAQDRLGTDLTVGKTQAQINAATVRPQIQQASLDEREVNNALSQYNRIEHYDPDDPADAALKKYFESRGLALPKKDKYRRPIATWANGQLVLTDDQGTRRATIDGEIVEDEARKPVGVTVGDQTFQVPQTQAEQSVRQRTTADANRAAADTRSRRAQEGQDRRLQRRLDAPSKVGTGSRGTSTDKTAMRKAANLVAQIDRARNEMESADKLGDKTKREQARIFGEQAASELNALGVGYEAGRGEGGYPYYKKGAQSATPQGGQYAGKRISKANAAIYGQRHNMTPEAAAEYLSGQGAIVY